MKTLQSMFANITDRNFITLTAAFGGLKAAFNNYVFSDWQFLIFLAVLVGVDTALGTYKAWKAKSLESRGWGRVIEKVLLYGSVLITTSALIRFPIAGTPTGLFDWADNVMYCAIMVREALSILENVAEIKPDLLPTWVLTRLKNFDESGNFKDLM